MTTFNVPQRKEVAPANQEIFDSLQNKLGFVPNLYATFAHSDTALGNYLQLQGGKTLLTNKEKEIVNLVVSEINTCAYCLSAHTTVGKMNGFSESEILDIRSGHFPGNEKFNALAQFTQDVASKKGKVDAQAVANFIAAGYTKGHVVDVIVAIGDKVIMNYLHNVTQVAIDFPLAQPLTTAAV